jgi:hypothetical protein
MSIQIINKIFYLSKIKKTVVSGKYVPYIKVSHHIDYLGNSFREEGEFKKLKTVF